MSRIGKQPIPLVKGVEVKLNGGELHVKGPNGSLTMDVHPDMLVTIADDEVRVERPSEQAQHRALHGLTRSLIANMVEGVTAGFVRTLEIVGVGYRAEKQGQNLNLALGFSHPVLYEPPSGIEIDVPNQTTVVVKGADKQVVGQVAAEIRSYRPPEPYKGKGIRYQGEQIRRKAGKTAGA
jgi:large subunit ribosomal protein L6